MSFGRTLILDSTMTPIRVVSWQDAILMVIKGKAKVLDEYENVLINSPSQAYKLPRILMIIAKSKRKKEIPFSKKSVFFRDNYTCGYCNKIHSQKELSLDHIKPVCQGGKSSWENIITACISCNGKKGGRTPEEARMPLLLSPYKPKWNPVFYLQLKSNDPIQQWEVWAGDLSNSLNPEK